MGSVSCTKEAYPALQRAQQETGICPSPDDVFLAMRGIRTIHARLPHHWTSGLRVAEWLMGRDEVAQVLHPAMEHDRGHALWKRDFLGSSSLFGFVLKPQYRHEKALAAMMDSMRLHGMGFSWGGFESLLIPVDPPSIRTATRWPREDVADGQLMRIHVGLEAVEDIIDDLRDGFDRLRAAS
jgi:cystathionine beta-lyase